MKLLDFSPSVPHPLKLLLSQRHKLFSPFDYTYWGLHICSDVEGAQGG